VGRSRKTHDFNDGTTASSVIRRRQTQVSSPSVTSARPYLDLNASVSSIPKWDCTVSTSSGESQTSPSTLQHFPQEVHENCIMGLLLVLLCCWYHVSVNGRNLDRMRWRMERELMNGMGIRQ